MSDDEWDSFPDEDGIHCEKCGNEVESEDELRWSEAKGEMLCEECWLIFEDDGPEDLNESLVGEFLRESSGELFDRKIGMNLNEYHLAQIPDVIRFLRDLADWARPEMGAKLTRSCVLIQQLWDSIEVAPVQKNLLENKLREMIPGYSPQGFSSKSKTIYDYDEDLDQDELLAQICDDLVNDKISYGGARKILIREFGMEPDEAEKILDGE